MRPTRTISWTTRRGAAATRTMSVLAPSTVTEGQALLLSCLALLLPSLVVCSPLPSSILLRATRAGVGYIQRRLIATLVSRRVILAHAVLCWLTVMVPTSLIFIDGAFVASRGMWSCGGGTPNIAPVVSVSSIRVSTWGQLRAPPPALGFPQLPPRGRHLTVGVYASGASLLTNGGCLFADSSAALLP